MRRCTIVAEEGVNGFGPWTVEVQLRGAYGLAKSTHKTFGFAVGDRVERSYFTMSETQASCEGGELVAVEGWSVVGE
jgi:hypothetical protein